MAKKVMAGLHLTLEQARQVINAHRNAELREQRKVAEQYVGKFYRTRNKFGGDDKGWWLYAAVTEAHDGGAVGGWQFQAMTNGEFQVRTEPYFWVDRGTEYHEIPARSFWTEWEKFKAKMVAIPEPRAQLRRRADTQKASER